MSRTINFGSIQELLVSIINIFEISILILIEIISGRSRAEGGGGGGVEANMTSTFK